MKLAALYSGGKDSTFAIIKAKKDGNEITHLITIFPKREDSYMFHYPCIKLTKFQAESIGIKHIIKKSSGNKYEELEDLKNVLKNLKGKIDGVLTGAVSSNYQKSRIDSICDSLGLVNISPLWGKDAYELLKEELKEGLDIIIVAVATNALDESWLGKKLNFENIKELKKMSIKKPFNIQFEGGEAESFVENSPIFKNKIIINDFDKFWDSKTSSGYIIVKKTSIIPK